MIVDIEIDVRKWWKQLWCHHDYHEHFAHTYPGFWYEECKKCGRWKR